MSNWINITGESTLPEEPATVLAYNPSWGDDDIQIAYFDGEEWLESEGMWPLAHNPTHWMYLPAAPAK